jgi:hypothetical protein
MSEYFMCVGSLVRLCVRVFGYFRFEGCVGHLFCGFRFEWARSQGAEFVGCCIMF